MVLCQQTLGPGVGVDFDKYHLKLFKYRNTVADQVMIIPPEVCNLFSQHNIPPHSAGIVQE